jgi:polyphosphate kinase
MRKLITAPFHMQRKFIEKIEAVGAAALKGLPARVVVKMNALTDPSLVHALVRAGQQGAQIDLIVRGACMLPAGVSGKTDNIRVRSIIGRFLEHSRVFYFEAGENQELFLGSADWMSRNMSRRIELAWPVDDPVLRRRIVDECLLAYLYDTRNAWTLDADGQYHRVEKKGQKVQSAQALLMGQYAATHRRKQKTNVSH